MRRYRRLYHIRSKHHPVPNLRREDDWLEAPFWAWRAGSRRRGRLFVRPDAAGGGGLVIADGAAALVIASVPKFTAVVPL